MLVLHRLKKIIISLLPPVFFDILLFFLFKLKGKATKNHFKQELEPSIPSKRDFLYSNGSKIYNIPIEKVFHYGGQCFNSVDQPFYRFLKLGKESLKQYYENHQPSSIYEAHNIKIENNSIKSNSLKYFDHRLPWLDQPEGNLSAEFGLNHHHGHSAFGPVSDKKLKLEIYRLKTCLKSLKRHGYIEWQVFPKIDADLPRGYLLQKKSGDFSVHIISGKHRVACMAYLGWKNIPIKFDTLLPRVVSEDNCESWPGVINGCYNKTEAIAIFNTYF
jgi:hypothetical protein